MKGIAARSMVFGLNLTASLLFLMWGVAMVVEGWRVRSGYEMVFAVVPLLVGIVCLPSVLVQARTLWWQVWYGLGRRKRHRQYQFVLEGPVVVSIGPIRARGAGLLRVEIEAGKSWMWDIMHQHALPCRVWVRGLEGADLAEGFEELLDGTERRLVRDACFIDIPIVNRGVWQATVELIWGRGRETDWLARMTGSSGRLLTLDVSLTGNFTGEEFPTELVMSTDTGMAVRGFEVVMPDTRTEEGKK